MTFFLIFIIENYKYKYKFRKNKLGYNIYYIFLNILR